MQRSLLSWAVGKLLIEYCHRQIILRSIVQPNVIQEEGMYIQGYNPIQQGYRVQILPIAG